MPGSAPLDILPLWALCACLLVGNLLLEECGFRLGRLRARATQKESDATVRPAPHRVAGRGERDLHAARIMAAIRNRMPLPVWLTLFAVGFLSFFTMGYQAGLSRASRSPAAVVLALTFVSVIWVVADLDRPTEGFLRVTQAPMIDVQKMMQPNTSTK